jgi:hypothetical protein
VKAQAFENELEQSFEAAVGETLYFENLLGSIRVLPQTRGRTVVVRAKARAEANETAEARRLAETVELRSEQRDGGTHWSVTYPEARLFRMPQAGVKSLLSKWVAPLVKRNTISTRYQDRAVEIGSARGAIAVAVDLEIIVPMDLKLSIYQHVGSIECSAIRGEISLNVREGVLEAGRVFGSLHAMTEGASARIWGFDGKSLVVETGSGNIDLKEVKATSVRTDSARGNIVAEGIASPELEASTGSGDLTLARVEPKTLTVSTDTGSVDLATEMKFMREASVRSATGNVTLRLGSFASFNLAANSPSGAVKGSGVNVEVDQREKNAAHIARGDGGANWLVDSESGQITVKPL